MSNDEAERIRMQTARQAWSIIMLAAINAANGDAEVMAGAVSVIEGQFKVLRELGVVLRPAAKLGGL